MSGNAIITPLTTPSPVLNPCQALPNVNAVVKKPATTRCGQRIHARGFLRGILCVTAYGVGPSTKARQTASH